MQAHLRELVQPSPRGTAEVAHERRTRLLAFTCEASRVQAAEKLSSLYFAGNRVLARLFAQSTNPVPDTTPVPTARRNKNGHHSHIGRKPARLDIGCASKCCGERHRTLPCWRSNLLDLRKVIAVRRISGREESSLSGHLHSYVTRSGADGGYLSSAVTPLPRSDKLHGAAKAFLCMS